MPRERLMRVELHRNANRIGWHMVIHCERGSLKDELMDQLHNEDCNEVFMLMPQRHLQAIVEALQGEKRLWERETKGEMARIAHLRAQQEELSAELLGQAERLSFSGDDQMLNMILEANEQMDQIWEDLSIQSERILREKEEAGD